MYSAILDQYDGIAGFYKGWTLTEIRNLAVRERLEWVQRAVEHNTRRMAATMTRE